MNIYQEIKLLYIFLIVLSPNRLLTIILSLKLVFIYVGEIKDRIKKSKLEMKSKLNKN